MEEKWSIGLKDTVGKDICIGDTIIKGEERYKICFGKYIGDNYGYDFTAYGTYMWDREGCKYPLHLDILDGCKVIVEEK